VTAILATFNWRDFLDILFLSLVAYHVYIWFWSAKARKVVIGLTALALVYAAAEYLELTLTETMFGGIWRVMIIVLIILFQTEIRQILERGSPLSYLRARRFLSEPEVIDDLAEAAFEMAGERTGALVVLVREDDPDEYITGGESVIAQPGRNLLKSIFNPKSPTHDGAVILVDGRLTAVGVVLPLTDQTNVPEDYGTRHRAAMGLSERTDCVCLVVSEERGQVATVVRGRIYPWETPSELARALKGYLGGGKSDGPDFRRFAGAVLWENWRAKLAALVFVSLVWAAVAGGQTITRPTAAYVGFVNLPEELSLGAGTQKQINVKVRGRRRDLGRLSPGRLTVDVDLKGLAAGRHDLRINAEDIDLPGGLTVDRFWSQNVQVELESRSGSSS
jgi:diadenylate cyclase